MIGKTVLLTGAAGGIGREIAFTFAEHGAALCLADLRSKAAFELADEIRALGGRAEPVAVDITDPDSVAAMVGFAEREVGPVDVLIHSAGLDAPRGSAWELPVDHWTSVIDVDLNGAWWCARSVIPSMIERRSGRIIFMGSVAGRRGSLSVSAAYSAAKAGLFGLTMSLARQLEQYRILVNTIAVGPTGTGEPMTDAERAADSAQFQLPIVGATPVAEACRYLADRSGDWISGTIMNVSGGRWQG